jgi:hypothetical protein
MKATALRIERWLSNIEAGLVPPQRKRLRVIVHRAVDKERALAELAARNPDAFAGRTVEDINWSDDMAAAKEKALAEHIAAHPEDAGRTVEDFGWSVWEIVHDLSAAEAEIAGVAVRNEITKGEIEDEFKSRPLNGCKDTDGPSETLEPIDLPPPDPGCLARSKPWRPVHQRPARDMRRPTWKKWER